MMDPAKLKVVELRAELSKRGLETKGNKPVLVERLRKALEDEIEHTAGEETEEVKADNEIIVESPQKHAREKTPDPVISSKTSGRSSRSSSTTTPTKISPGKAIPKLVLTPISEKHLPQTVSPITDKTEEINDTIEAVDPASATLENTPVIEKQEEEVAIVPAVDTIPETPKDTSVNEPIASELTDTVTEKIQPEVEQSVPEQEEKVPSEKVDSVEVSNEPIETSSHPEPELPEENLPDTNRREKEISDEHSVPEESISQDQEMVNDGSLEKEKVGDNKESQDLAEPMESSADVEEQEKCAVAAEIKDTTLDSSMTDMTEEKSDIQSKEEVNELSNIDNALQPDEKLQDTEMKELTDETEDNSKRDSKEQDRKDRADRKRKRSSSPQEERAKSPPPTRVIDEPELNETDIVLSWYDSDMNLGIDKENFLSATPMHDDGFGYIWAGARASYGFIEGKVYYEAKIVANCDVNLQDEQSPHVLRVGWSVQGTSMQLGEESLSYGFDGTGKISTDNNFSDYGTAFGKDDVVGCYVDFTNENDVVMSYTINGKEMGAAFTVAKDILAGKPLYPHILTKNCTFFCNFGQEKPWCEILDGYTVVGAVDSANRVQGPRRPEKTEECEVIMMCGLPAAGKTVWATKYAVEHREKMYNILGTNSLIEKMKVHGLPRGPSFHGGWEALIEKCTKCLNKLLELASTRRRNYIIDQTNVYSSVQRRKMRNFDGYQRRAIVVVPADEELKARTAKRTASEGGVIADCSVLEMKANFSAPVVGDTFDAVEWVELSAEEGKQLIEKYNKEGKEAGYGQQQASKRPRVEKNDNHRDNRDSRQSSRDNRDNRDHRDRRNNYPDRNRNSTWRGGSSSGGWRDRQQRPAGGGHARHGGSNSSGSGSGYGGQSSGGWRPRTGNVSGPSSSYRPSADRRVASTHDRRTSGMDRNRSVSSRQGGWGSMNSYQGSQPSGGWGGSSQSGNWQGSQSQQQASWGNQLGGWGQQQQWGSWKGYGQANSYSQGNYSQSGYGNGNWGGWNQQYYNQYWGQQQQSGQTSAAGSQAGNTSSSGATGSSTPSTGSTYSNYSSSWQGYPQSYGYSTESSNTNAQQQK